MKKTEPSFKVLVVDDEANYREVLKMILEDNGYLVELASGGEEAVEILNNVKIDLVLTDLLMDGMDGIELLLKIKESHPLTEVIIITGYGTIENAVKAMKKGALSYFVKGHDPVKLLKEIAEIREKVPGTIREKLSIDKSDVAKFFLRTKNKHFRKVIDIVERAAQSKVNILILGESGVGKEVFARYIHECSGRMNGRFVPVNCQAFAGGLLESELFGHEKGSFTGAIEKRKGRFEIANGGTLFLDEVGDVALNTQVKLLRVLETKKVERLGSCDPITVDFRLISATNKNLSEEILTSRLREDFFYRISTITIEIPPLRSRKEDLPMLIDFFLEKSQIEHNKTITKIEPGVKEFLLSYNYPGNVREMKNIIERLVVLSLDGVITHGDLPDFWDDNIESSSSGKIKHLKEIRKEVEAEYIQKVLQKCDNKMSETAKYLGISRRQLFNKINEYSIK